MMDGYDIIVRPTEYTREWQLLRPISFGGVTVPEGFVFDGASIPLGLRWLFPHGGKKFFGACIHDYCYSTGCVGKDEADRLFLRAMLANGVSKIKANAMFYAVSLFGLNAWLDHRIGRYGGCS